MPKFLLACSLGFLSFLFPADRRTMGFSDNHTAYKENFRSLYSPEHGISRKFFSLKEQKQLHMASAAMTYFFAKETDLFDIKLNCDPDLLRKNEDAILWPKSVHIFNLLQ